MGFIKHFFIINSRGNPICVRSFLCETNRTIIERFYQSLKEETTPPPVFRVDGLTYSYITCNSLYFVVATSDSMSPTLLELLLRRITTVLNDYIGRCSEMSLQNHIGLLYEVVDEVLSFGCPQATDSESLLHLVYNEVPYDTNLLTTFLQTEIFIGEGYLRPLALAPTERSKTNNELFVIISEKVSLTMSVQNQILQSSISGLCSCKSFLQGLPTCYIQIDPQCYFVSRNMPHNLSLRYDDITFSPVCVTTSFDSDRSISFTPPEGSSLLFTYRTSREITPPFTLFSAIENIQAKVVVVRISVQSVFRSVDYATNVKISFQCPIETSNATCELPSSVRSNQQSEYDSKARQVHWIINKFDGKSEFSARFRFIFDNGIQASVEKLLGPISINYDYNGALPSGLNVKNFSVSTQGTSNPPHRYYKETSSASSYTWNYI